MPLISSICNSYKQEAFRGVHQAGDEYYLALFTPLVTLDANTTIYSATGEVVDANYNPGGQLLTGFNTGISGTTAWFTFDSPVTWNHVTFTLRGALIYNKTRGNKAVATLNFGLDVAAIDNTVSIIFPAADATHALVRWAGP